MLEIQNPLTLLNACVLGLGIELEYQKTTESHVFALTLTWTVGKWTKVWAKNRGKYN